MIRLLDLNKNIIIELATGNHIFGRGVHNITDKHCSRKQAEFIANNNNNNDNSNGPTLYVKPLGLNPVRVVDTKGEVTELVKDKPFLLVDGTVFALYGDYKYKAFISSNIHDKRIEAEKLKKEEEEEVVIVDPSQEIQKSEVNGVKKEEGNNTEDIKVKSERKRGANEIEDPSDISRKAMKGPPSDAGLTRNSSLFYAPFVPSVRAEEKEGTNERLEKAKEARKNRKIGTTHGKLVAIYHEKCLEHNVPDWHLETPHRLRVAIEAINELSRHYLDEVFHVVRNPSPGAPTISHTLSFASPHLSYTPLSFFNDLPPSLDRAPSTLNPSLPPPTEGDTTTRPTVPLPPFKLLSRELLETCHDPAYLDSIMNKIPLDSQPLHATQYSQDDRELPEQGDTFVSSGTWDAALYASSVVCLAVDYVASGHFLHAFCAVRPPGHHAGKKGRTLDACSQGYCILNNIAIGAMYARNQYLFSKIIIVDFDVHHGNGTQEIIGSREGFMFISIHVGDLYPHTGGKGEKTHVTQNGKIVNISLHPNSAPKVFKKHFEDTVIPKIEAFEPQLIMLSSGFDGHKSDPTEGGLRLTKTEYRYITELLKDVAFKYCGGKMISVLEGGYHLPSLKKCVEEHLTVLADH